MNREREFDIIICGAGPAGSTCALALAGSGLKVALIDKGNFPRDKICGDAIAPYVPKVLRTINPKFADAFNDFEARVIVDTYRLYAPNGKHVDVTAKESGIISKRLDWDQFLFDLVVAEGHVNCFMDYAITDVEIKEGELPVRVTANGEAFNAKLVIGCDGAHSIIGRRTREVKRDLDHHSAAVRAYFSNVSGLSDKTFEFHLFDGLPGYFWIFPLQDNIVNVGFGALSAAISKNKINLRETFMKKIWEGKLLKDRFLNATMLGEVKGFDLPLGSRKVPISGDHFMLCGDAASLIDPLSGEGIGQAMVSGRYAGWHAIKCFEQNNFTADFMKQYNKQVYDKLWAKSRKSYYLQKYIMTKPRIVNGLVSTANRHKTIHSLFARALT